MTVYVSNHIIKSRKVLLLTSTLLLMGVDTVFTYTASQFALNGMMQATARSLAKHNIRVCTVPPHILKETMSEEALDSLLNCKFKLLPICLYDKVLLSGGI